MGLQAMTISRRDFLDFLAATCAAAALPSLTFKAIGASTNSAVMSTRFSELTNSGALVNDIHSQLNATRVDRVIKPRTSNDLRATILGARLEHKPISIAGGRHAMGGQQFGEGSVLIDMTSMNRVLDFDAERGIVEVEGGIEWPQLIDYLIKSQEGCEKQWGIVQKQTGADRLSIGGALASNVHGRGLKLKPIIDQVDSFTLMNHTGEMLRCSRYENPELFRLVIGGYGLFGIVISVRLRVWERRK